MRREGPQDVLLAPDLSEVEPVRIEVLQPPEPPVAHQFFKLEEGRVILQQMADHQPAVEALGERARALRPRSVSRASGFSTKTCLPASSACFGERVMQDGGRRDRDGGDRWHHASTSSNAAALAAMLGA